MTAEAAPPRLAGLDVLRGLAITGMVLVNNPGSWEHTVPALGHAPWHGWVFGDLIFPAFLVAVGVGMAYSSDNRPRRRFERAVVVKVVRRAVVLFALGLALNLQREPSFGDVRVMGILQRIALAGLVTALIVLVLPRAAQVAVGIVILAAYAIALTTVDVPGPAPQVLTPESNLASHLDLALLGRRHMYNDGLIDPEGVVGSAPSVVSVLIGAWSGAWLRTRGASLQAVVGLAAGGTALAGLGLVWHSALPINKQLWTSSYVLFSGGMSVLALALLVAVVDVARQRVVGWPWEVLGGNALLAYVGTAATFHVLRTTPPAAIEAGGTWRDRLQAHVFEPALGPLRGSYAFAVALLAVWWLILVVLHRRGWRLRV